MQHSCTCECCRNAPRGMLPHTSMQLPVAPMVLLHTDDMHMHAQYGTAGRQRAWTQSSAALMYPSCLTYRTTAFEFKQASAAASLVA